MQSINTRWLHLLGVLVLTAALAACGGRATPGNRVAVGALSDHAQQEDGGNGSEATLHAVATDFGFALNASQVRAGKVTFLVKTVKTTGLCHTTLSFKAMAWIRRPAC
jgi:hypothetical protein